MARISSRFILVSLALIAISDFVILFNFSEQMCQIDSPKSLCERIVDGGEQVPHFAPTPRRSKCDARGIAARKDKLVVLTAEQHRKLVGRSHIVAYGLMDAHEELHDELMDGLENA